MPINFPASLDSLSNPTSSNKQNSPSHSEQHANANDAIEALETKVGVDNSAVATTLDYLIKNTSSSNPGHKHTLANGATDVTASAVELNTLDGITASTAELNILDGVTATAAEINALAGNMGAWLDWTITWTNLTLGSGTVVSKYQKIGRKVDFFIIVQLAADSAVGSGVLFSLPITAVNPGGNSTVQPIGIANFENTGAAQYQGIVKYNSTTAFRFHYNKVVGDLVRDDFDLTSTEPFTWGTDDGIYCRGSYQSAT